MHKSEQCRAGRQTALKWSKLGQNYYYYVLGMEGKYANGKISCMCLCCIFCMVWVCCRSPRASPAGEQSEGSSAKMETVFATRRALSSGSRWGLSGTWLGDSFTRVLSCGKCRTRMNTSSSIAANTRDLPGTSSPVSPPSPRLDWESFSASSSLPEKRYSDPAHFNSQTPESTLLWSTFASLSLDDEAKHHGEFTEYHSM